MKKIVIATTAKDENIYLGEWIKRHVDLGFEEISIYDNMSEVPAQTEVDRLPEEYRSKVRVVLEPVSMYPQRLAYNKALDWYRDKAEWCAFIDVDEFVVTEEPLAEILDSLHPDVGALFISWKYFNAAGQKKYEDRPVTERFTESCPIRHFIKGKSIVRLSHALQIKVHYPVLYRRYKMVNADGIWCLDDTAEPVYKKIWLNHYYTRSYEEWVAKIKRGTGDSQYRKKYKEFFVYNPDMAECYDETLENAEQKCGEELLAGTGAA